MGTPTPGPGQAASFDAAVQAAAEVLFRDYESQYSAGHLTWRDFADLARKTLEAAIGASAAIVAEYGWTPPEPASADARRVRTVLAQVLTSYETAGKLSPRQIADARKRARLEPS